MNYEICEIDEKNSKDVLELRVSEAQRGYIESLEVCLKDAEDWPEFRPVGLYVDGRLVGFAMYGALLDSGGGRNLWLDRLLIDERFQRRGYGRRFTELLIERMLSEYGEQPIYLSVYGENNGAICLYENLGFEFIHEYDSDGEMIFRK